MTTESFIDEHGWTVMAALDTYIDEMRTVAADLMKDYEKVKDDPERSAAQDESMITTIGLRNISLQLTESADAAVRAREAWLDIIEGDEE